MKVSLIISEKAKQVMLTPEDESEKLALKMISSGNDIEVAVKDGRFHSGLRPAGYEIDMCQGGYLRAWDSEDSIMLVLTPKNPEASEEKS